MCPGDAERGMIMDRKEKIDYLVTTDIDMILDNVHEVGEWLDSVFRHGQIGYEDMSDEQINFEYNDRIE